MLSLQTGVTEREISYRTPYVSEAAAPLPSTVGRLLLAVQIFFGPGTCC